MQSLFRLYCATLTARKIICMRKMILTRTRFSYKPISSLGLQIHYMATDKLSKSIFNHMTYLMSHMICLNNTCKLSYELSHCGFVTLYYKLVCSLSMDTI
jgi:hypothetical protein